MGTATVLLLSFLLFYFPTVFNFLSERHAPPAMWKINMVMATCYTFLFCINYFLMIPRFIFGEGRRVWFYVLNGVMIVALLCVVPLWFESHGGLPGPGPGDYPRESPSIGRLMMHYTRFALRDSVMMVLSVGLAYALRLSREREKFRHRELELDAERRSLELRSLKMQLNPHFLFNSLNNIYSLIAINPAEAQEALHDLSGMLRYMIYDAGAAGVPLSKEIDFVEDFVRLSALRLGDEVDLRCETDKAGTEQLTIAPLLLLTLVENAFKHYASTAEGAYIHIKVKADGDWVECRVENSCLSDGESGAGGVGINNIERQLALLYPGSYSLEQQHSEGRHKAILRLRREVLIKPDTD